MLIPFKTFELKLFELKTIRKVLQFNIRFVKSYFPNCFPCFIDHNSNSYYRKWWSGDNKHFSPPINVMDCPQLGQLCKLIARSTSHYSRINFTNLFNFTNHWKHHLCYNLYELDINRQCLKTSIIYYEDTIALLPIITN